jgi:low temperature requirement protein LtrA
MEPMTRVRERQEHGLLGYVPMRARSRDDAHRSATPLELLFDLCFVVAVAQLGQRLVHDMAEGHPGHGVTLYLVLFFAIWWAWVNFTWFASAYDCDDVLYRVATFVMMTGALVVAAGVPRAFDQGDFTAVVIGYVIMRLALVAQWLRAAYGETGAARIAALRFAGGLAIVQVAWVGLLLLPNSWWWWGFLPLVVADLAVPAFAERAHPTSWHPRHIAERYGLFTIIVLGESILAATVAVQSGLAATSAFREVLPIAFGGLLIVFSAFWIYFAVPAHEYLTGMLSAFVWGYGHYLVFASAAAIGAGLEVAVEQATGEAHISTVMASAAVTIPTALFLIAVWLVHAGRSKRTLPQQLILPLGAAVTLACTFAGSCAVPLVGLVAAGQVAVGVYLNARLTARPAASGIGTGTAEAG